MQQNANGTKQKWKKNKTKYKHDKIQKFQNTNRTKYKLPKKCNKIKMQQNTNGTKYN